jgi:hypothetical protein
VKDQLWAEGCAGTSTSHHGPSLTSSPFCIHRRRVVKSLLPLLLLPLPEFCQFYTKLKPPMKTSNCHDQNATTVASDLPKVAQESPRFRSGQQYCSWSGNLTHSVATHATVAAVTVVAATFAYSSGWFRLLIAKEWMSGWVDGWIVW